ncbi:hypothetical protein SEPCBS119000_000893 [Sporothrix epigloea]|uniref:Uncharacterized protein n=1 Tax=Sporothrix epigloea TaxID=1892477 RepID=A0ABP0D9F9_9PEZI
MTSTSRRKVNFSDSTLLGGSSGGHYSSSRGGVSERAELDTLRDQYEDMMIELNKWKTLAQDRKEDVKASKKLASDAEDKCSAMAKRNVQLQDEKNKLSGENEDLKTKIDEQQDTIDELRKQLADTNKRWNELPPNVISHHTLADAQSPASRSRHSLDKHEDEDDDDDDDEDDPLPSTPPRTSSTAGSGTSVSSGTSRSSSRAKVGSTISGTSSSDPASPLHSANTARPPRSSSRPGFRHHSHHHENARHEANHRDDNFTPKNRLVSRFDTAKDSSGPSSPNYSPTPQRHHSGGDGSASNTKHASPDSGGIRPSHLRTRRGSYVEGHGPGMALMPQAQGVVSPIKTPGRSPQSPGMMSPACVVPGGTPSPYYERIPYVQAMTPAQYGMPHPPTGLMYPRG